MNPVVDQWWIKTARSPCRLFRLFGHPRPHVDDPNEILGASPDSLVKYTCQGHHFTESSHAQTVLNEVSQTQQPNTGNPARVVLHVHSRLNDPNCNQTWVGRKWVGRNRDGPNVSPSGHGGRGGRPPAKNAPQQIAGLVRVGVRLEGLELLLRRILLSLRLGFQSRKIPQDRLQELHHAWRFAETSPRAPGSATQTAVPAGRPWNGTSWMNESGMLKGSNKTRVILDMILNCM